MENLAQIETIKQKIRTASTAATTALHKFIFGEEGDRKNRQRLREFSGFTFRKDTPQYVDKLESGRRLTIGDLISCCNVGLEYNGTKEEIIVRILNGLMNLNTLTPVDDEDDVEEEDDREDSEADETKDDEPGNENVHERQPVRVDGQTRMKFSMTYRDVEDSIKTFSGKDAYPIERWIANFEDTAELFAWTELQKVVFAKKSGPAKMLIESEGVVRTWKKLKTILRDEFAGKVNSAQVHEMLVKRRLRKEETLQEYYYAMKELAARGKIEPSRRSSSIQLMVLRMICKISWYCMEPRS